jgi:eukaryotic-like serine/threonine-protein kinase
MPGIYHRPLARLQLGRAERQMGNDADARESYEKFLSIWKDADPDLSVYRQAKVEYAQPKYLGNQGR